MAGALTLLLVGCLLRGALCEDFQVTIPRSIKTLSGSCVTIPCSFDIENSHEKYFDKTCKAIWRTNDKEVFDSTEQTGTNGELLGELTEKNCTTTLKSITAGKYFFRLDCDHLKYSFDKENQVVEISILAKPPTPTLTPSTLEVKEGTSVSLKCSASAPCLSHPPTLTWTLSLGDSQETLQEDQGKAKVMTSVLTFTASHLHHGKTIACTATYKKQDGVESATGEDLTLNISYSPKHTTVTASPSGPVREDSHVTLTCSSTANPAVRNYTWYRADGEQETFIGSGRTLNITASKFIGHFFCKAENDLGEGRSNKSQIDVQYSPKHTTVTASPSGPVREDSHVTLTCSSTANPAVRNYTWYRADGEQETFIGSGRTLNITASKFIGHFFCKAENDLGEGRSNKSQIDVQYSPKHTTVTASPSGPVREDSHVTLTCSSTANPAVRNYTWYRADGEQETFIGSGRTLNITASKFIGHFFCKAENDLGEGRSNKSQIDVQFSPQILHSSDCTKTVSQVNCSCETVGNPFPILHWYLEGLRVDHSDKFAISSESLNDTGLKSIITVNQPQWRELSTLVCHSSNSLGTASQRFCVNSLGQQTAAGSQGQMTLPVFITTVVALLVLVCALLIVIRVQKTHHNFPKSQCTGDNSTVAMSQLLIRSEGNEAPNTAEEDIYINAARLREADVPHPATMPEPNSINLSSSGPNNAEEASKSSQKTSEGGNDVIYSQVNWKSKSKKKKREDSLGLHLPGSSYLEEEGYIAGCMCRDFVSNAREVGSLYDEVQPRNVKKDVESEYAQVKYK